MKESLVTSEQINRVLHLTLNDSEHQNTLNNEMISELDKKFKEASQDKNVKVIILSGSGKVCLLRQVEQRFRLYCVTCYTN